MEWNETTVAEDEVVAVLLLTQKTVSKIFSAKVTGGT